MKASSPCSQKPATDRHPEPNESSPGRSEIKLKDFQVLIKHPNMKTDGEVEVYIHSFLA
jgi:hypothetical protein